MVPNKISKLNLTIVRAGLGVFAAPLTDDAGRPIVPFESAIPAPAANLDAIHLSQYAWHLNNFIMPTAIGNNAFKAIHLENIPGNDIGDIFNGTKLWLLPKFLRVILDKAH